MNARFAVAAALSLACAGTAHAADAFPTRPIKIVVPLSPGTAGDSFARMMSDGLAAKLGQSVVVENKPGAASAIGTNYVAKAEPDGYTLLMSMNTHYLTPATRKTPYDPVTDFTPVGKVVYGPLVIVTHPSTPAGNFPEFVSYLKKQGDQATFSSPGVGSTTHLYTVVLQDMLGTNMRHIPANGMTTALMDTMQNSATMLITGIDSGGPLVKSGKLKALAVTGPRPLEAFPGVSTLEQAGHKPPVDLSVFVGMYAPAGTPKAIVDRLNKAVAEVMDTPQMRASVQEKGYELALGTPEEFAAFNRREFEFWQKMVKQHGLQAND
jgi:tripartite-type tricarboxylate transporter receptor subunit TctC